MNKFRYVLVNIHTGQAEFKYLTLQEIEQGELTKLSPDWSIIARDRYTEINDMNDKEIYENDIVYEADWWWGPGYVILDKGHAGPCTSPSVVAWITCRNLANPKLNRCYNLWHSNQIQNIGNIYENPDLLKIRKPENLDK